MLGLSSYAEAPFADTGVHVAVNAFVTGGAPSTSGIGTLTAEGKASVTANSVLATMSFDGAGLTQVFVRDKLSSVSATSAAGTLSARGKAKTTLPSANGTISLGILFSAQSTITLSGVSAVYRFNKPSQTAVQYPYEADGYVQENVVTIRTTIKNKIVYVR